MRPCCPPFRMSLLSQDSDREKECASLARAANRQRSRRRRVSSDSPVEEYLAFPLSLSNDVLCHLRQQIWNTKTSFSPSTQQTEAQQPPLQNHLGRRFLSDPETLARRRLAPSPYLRSIAPCPFLPAFSYRK